MQTIDLKKLGLQNSGNYCDPFTGECYSDLDQETQMTTKIDPVCKMEVETETAKFTSEYEGEKYYFCSAGCQREFEENPAQFLQASAHD